MNRVNEWLREWNRTLLIKNLEKENENLKGEIKRLKSHIEYLNGYVAHAEKMEEVFRETLS